MLLRQSRRLRGILPQLQCATTEARNGGALAQQQLTGPALPLPPAAALCTAPAAAPTRAAAATLLRSAAVESALWARSAIPARGLSGSAGAGAGRGGDSDRDGGRPPLVEAEHLGEGEEPDFDAEAAEEAEEGIQARARVQNGCPCARRRQLLLAAVARVTPPLARPPLADLRPLPLPSNPLAERI